MKIVHPEMLYRFLKDFESSMDGWDFSYIESTKRIQEYPLDWSYRSILMRYLAHAEYALDMGTGGGEFLSSLFLLPPHTYATESYVPNVPIAKKNLSSLNIPVLEVKHNQRLPFESSFFDVIMNRHDYYQPNEVYRVLKPKGYFITQQVGDQNAIELNRWFQKKNDGHSWNLNQASSDLKDCCFTLIDTKEAITETRFFDIGAVLFYLKVISWQIPDFNVQENYSRIVELHNKIETEGFFDCSCHRFLIIAQK
ncbi:MAG: methyltransferase domain-containing protein [Caldisericia bacterium]|nr:methyltransferase domain-containing protein [Caldisericia bacterium]